MYKGLLDQYIKEGIGSVFLNFKKYLILNFLDFSALKANMSLLGLFSKGSSCSLMKLCNNGFLGSTALRHYSIWEPDYLILAVTKTPEYDKINVQIKGYDFVILENFQKFITKIARKMKINILKSFPVPQQDLEIHHYKTNSTDVKYKYDLKLHERNIQVVDVKSHIMPLFIEMVITSCPPGVNISFHEHEDYMEENRYLPNPQILELKEELENVGLSKKKKKS